MMMNCCPATGVKPLMSKPFRVATPAPRLTVPVTCSRSYSVPAFTTPISILKVVPCVKVTLPTEVSRPALFPGATVPLAAVILPTVPEPPSVPPVIFTGLVEVSSASSTSKVDVL